jgi:hypothetical protein
MINKASKLYGVTVKIIRREARYGFGWLGWGKGDGGRNNGEKRK